MLSATIASHSPIELEGRYQLAEPLGKGTSSVVFSAWSLPAAFADHGCRRVAVKLLREAYVGDLDAIARFTHEAFLASRLRHSNLVRVIDFGWARPDRPYLVMKQCTGLPLDRILADHANLAPAMALMLVTQLAEALATLHEHGVVHRDVKPSNVYVKLGGRRLRAQLGDLGIAAIFDHERARKIGGVDVGGNDSYGTPAYIAPEQALGHKLDARADVYGLACLTYRALTGFEPFIGPTVNDVVRAHLFEPAPQPSRLRPTIPHAVDAVLARGMAKAPHERTESAPRFAAELAMALRSTAARSGCGADFIDGYADSSATISAAMARARST